ncbi:50S ribosomal protein L22 [bacterium]|nr:50S ribosomal protein L22 [bacterium]
MKTYARLKNLGVPALKVRRFAHTIKGEPVDRATAILDLQPSPTCQALSKLLKSAIANAQNNNGLAPEYLFVSNVFVDQGPTMKRIHPRARGRAYRIFKRSSHVTIELDLKQGAAEKIAAAKVAEEKPKRKSRAAAQKSKDAKESKE